MAKTKRFDYKTLFFGMPVILAGLVATVFLSYYMYSSDKHENQLRFEYETEDISRRIQFQMRRYEEVLNHVSAFLQSSKNVSREEFNNFFDKIRLLERYPGIRGLGLTLKIEKNKLEEHLKELRQTIPGYKVWPENKRDVYFSIVYLNPMDEDNSKAIGYDMFSDPMRREAMQKAWDTGTPQLSGRVVLVQEQGKEYQPGFNLYVPYYKNNVALTTDQDKQDALIGFVYSPFRTNELFQSMRARMSGNIAIEIFDTEKLLPENALYTQDGGYSFQELEKSPHLSTTKKLSLYGRDLTIRFITTPKFKLKSIYLAPLFVLISGILITLLIAYIFTITKRQAEESQKSKTALQEALRARDEFISIASHELKTPLTSIKLQTQMMKRTLEKELNPDIPRNKVETFISKTEKQELRLERLVDDMLDISRMKAGKLTIEKEEFNLNTLIQDILFHMKEQFKNIPGGTPKLKFGKSVSGLWDKMRMEQVITNLLTNALKYGENKEIEITTEATDNQVTLSVKDYGIGISPEFQEIIFNRFERAGISATEISGLGIGLYITQQIVKSHGGDISVKSAPQAGSTFTVTLPRSI